MAPYIVKNLKFQDFSGHRCWVSGWGKDQFGVAGSYQNVLKEVDVTVMDHGTCQTRLRNTRLGQNFLLHPGFLCAGLSQINIQHSSD